MTRPAPPSAPRRRRLSFAALIGVVVVTAAACGAPLMKLPPVPPGASAAQDARQVSDQATAACRALAGVTGEIGVKGSIGGRRIRASLVAGLAAPSSVRLEALAASQPIFFFVARGADATLVIPPPDDRVLRSGPADQVLEAVTGLRISPEDLRDTLTGCVPHPAVGAMRVLGDDWRVAKGEITSYWHREHARAPWHLVATIRRDSAGAEWRAEFKHFVSGLPTEIRLVSSIERRFDLRLALSLEAAELKDEDFRLQIRPSARPITLDELRDAGPLGVPAR